MENDEILKTIEEEKSRRRWSSRSDEENNWTDENRIALFMLGLRLKDGRITEKALDELDGYRWQDVKFPEDDWRHFACGQRMEGRGWE